MHELEGDLVDDVISCNLRLLAELHLYIVVSLIFFVKDSTSPADHDPLTQLGEVCWKISLIGDVTVFAIISDCKEGDRCGVINIQNLSKEGSTTVHKMIHSVILVIV